VIKTDYDRRRLEPTRLASTRYVRVLVAASGEDVVQTAILQSAVQFHAASSIKRPKKKWIKIHRPNVSTIFGLYPPISGIYAQIRLIMVGIRDLKYEL